MTSRRPPTPTPSPTASGASERRPHIVTGLADDVDGPASKDSLDEAGSHRRRDRRRRRQPWIEKIAIGAAVVVGALALLAVVADRSQTDT